MGSPIEIMDVDNGKIVYEFANFVVDPVRRRLLCDGEPIAITSKAFDTLLILVERRSVTVTKSELMNLVWPDAAVEENNLTQQISALRRALGERPNDHRFIVTVPGRGYCFVAEIEQKAEVAATPGEVGRPGLFESATLRGYSIALSYVLLLVLAFAWSAVQSADGPQTLAVLTFRAADRGDEDENESDPAIHMLRSFRSVWP